MIQEHGKIKVADITLAHLSRGLYRSNATVFKELINNAYDADAETVRINTNYPIFDFVSCVDDGTGMPIEKFLDHFGSSGIGSSVKRKSNRDASELHGRPIIGRLGIGMMAIGQLCHSFEIESHYIDHEGNKKAFKAEIVLTDSSIELEEEIIRKDNFNGKDVDVGDWSCEEIDFDNSKKGFRIYSADVRGTFRREMQESFSDSKLTSGSLNIDDLAKTFYTSKSIRDCKPYLETIWELCTLCPLPYQESERSPLNFDRHKEIDITDQRIVPFLIERDQLIRSYKFDVHFDGVALKRVIHLPTETNEDKISPKVFFFNYDKIIFDTRLKFAGYFFSQIPKAIRPYELKGIQVRLRNVGIGGYDSTFLRYSRKIESIRNQWVSGEVFVDEGLEAALNIDRDSFNEHEEHFKAMQKFIHDHVDSIFDQSREAAASRSGLDNEHKIEEANRKIGIVVDEFSNGVFAVDQDNILLSDEPLLIKNSGHNITLNSNAKPIGKNRKKANDVYRISLLAFQVAKRMANNEEEREEMFSDLLKKFFKQADYI